MATGSCTQDFYSANGRYRLKPEVTSVAAMSGLPPKLDPVANAGPPLRV